MATNTADRRAYISKKDDEPRVDWDEIARGNADMQASMAAAAAGQNAASESAFPTNAGFNLDRPRPRPTGANTNHINALSTNDPTKMSEMDRQFALTQGLDIDSAVRGRGDEQSDWERYFRQTGMEAYDPILRGQGGYSPEDRADIIQKLQLGELQWTPEMANALQLTDEEKVGIAGDPNKAGLYFDPGYNEDIDRESATRQRQANTDATDRLRENYAVAEQRLNDAINPALMRMDPTRANEAIGAVQQSAAQQRAAVDPTRLRQSEDFVRRYRMGDEDVQDLVQSAAGQVRVSGQRAIDDLEKAVAATGAATPLAAAAARSRLERGTAADQADALMRARIAAKAEQAGRERDIEGMRVDAERGYSGLRSGIERGIGTDLAGVTLDTERTRIGAEQGLTDVQTGNARTVAGLRQDAETQIGNRALATEQGIGQQAADTQRYNTNTGIALAQGADDRASNRAGMIATNRQDATALGQQSQYQRGTGIADRISANTQTAADAKRADEKEARGYLSGQQELASNNVNTANDQRITNYGVQGRLMNDATQNTQAYDVNKSRKGGFWNSFKNSFGESLGRAATGQIFGGGKP